MIIQNIGGGLGVQIMSYVFARYIQRRNPKQELLFDDTDLIGANCHGYGLEKAFGLRLDILSQYLDWPDFQMLMSYEKKRPTCSQIPRIFCDAGFPIVVIKKRGMYYGKFKEISISLKQGVPDLSDLPYSNLYCYYDWWVDDYWFEQDREENRRELVFPQLTDYQNLKYQEQIEKCPMPVGIHVRRGDFVVLGMVVSPTNYQPICKKVLDEYPNACFFVFSDDPNWCRAHASEMGLDLAAQTIYIEGNDHGRNYIDMQLMSMCRGLIRSEDSTFSRTAAWLSKDLKFRVDVENPRIKKYRENEQ